MAILSRGLTTDFVNALSATYNESSWWKSIVDDPELFVTPRNLGVRSSDRQPTESLVISNPCPEEKQV